MFGLGNLLGIGSSLIGGFLQNRAQARANDANLEAVRETNAANREMFDIQTARTDHWNEVGRNDSNRWNRLNFLWAKDRFNQLYKQSENQWNDMTRSRLQNTVADAKAAGVHPLFALGGSLGGGGAPPVGVDGMGQFIPGQYASGSAMAAGVQSAGGEIGAAVSEAGARAAEYLRSERRGKTRDDMLQLGEHLRADQLATAAAKKDEAIAGYYRSMEAKTVQEMNAKQDTTKTTGMQAARTLGSEAPSPGPLPKGNKLQMAWGTDKTTRPRATVEEVERVRGGAVGELHGIMGQLIDWFGQDVADSLYRATRAKPVPGRGRTYPYGRKRAPQFDRGRHPRWLRR